MLRKNTNAFQVPSLATTRTNEDDSGLYSDMNLTPASRAYGDIMAPRVPFGKKDETIMDNGNEEDELTIANPNAHLSPSSRAYADITGPSLPFAGRSTYDRMYTASTTTTTTTTTTTRPMQGGSLKEHMAKLSAAKNKSPVVPTPAGSPWGQW